VPAVQTPAQNIVLPGAGQCEVFVPASMIYPPTTEPMLVYVGACDQANAYAASPPGLYVVPG
jgi:hypothetical protein